MKFLKRLLDVSAESPANGDALVYNSTTKKWESGAGGSVTVPGSDTWIIFNAAGVLGASADFTWDGTSVNIGADSGSGSLYVYGDITIATNGSKFRFSDSGFLGQFRVAGGGLTGSRDWYFPDANGVVTLYDNVDLAAGSLIAGSYWLRDVSDLYHTEILHGSTLTADRAVTIKTGDADAFLATAQEVSSNGTPIYSATNPVYFKDTAGTPHYWSAYLNTSGVLVTTDLGTTPP